MARPAILTIFYWIVIITLPIGFLRIYFLSWLDAQTYLKSHGSFIGMEVICVPLPPTIITISICLLIGLSFFWIRSIENRTFRSGRILLSHYIELFLLSSVFIGPFILFDAKIIQLLFYSLSRYLSA